MKKSAGKISLHVHFKASTGWLDKFKNRHGIRNLSIQGEKLSAAEETVEPFLQKLNKVIEERGLIPEQIYNADETGLFKMCYLYFFCLHCLINQYSYFRLSGLSIIRSIYLSPTEVRLYHQGQK